MTRAPGINICLKPKELITRLKLLYSKPYILQSRVQTLDSPRSNSQGLTY